MPRGLYRRYFSPGNYLSGQTRDIEFAGGEMPFSKTELPGSIILELLDVPRRQFSYVDPPSGRWVTLDLTGVPYLTLWSDGDHSFASNLAGGLLIIINSAPLKIRKGFKQSRPRRTARVVQHGSGTCLV